MYYNNIYFHNVNLMKKDENGNYLLSRFEEDFLFEKQKKNKAKVTVSSKETMPNFNENSNENSEQLVSETETSPATQTEAPQNETVSETATIQEEAPAQAETQENSQNENVDESNVSENVEQAETQSIVAEEKPSLLDPFKEFTDLSLGVELRFKLITDVVKIKLKLLDGQNPALLEVYFGNYFAGKNYSLTVTDSEVLELTFNRAEILKPNKKSKNKLNFGFSSEIVRILLPTRNVLFCGVEGQTEIPQVYEMPTKSIVFFGSNGLGASEIDKPSLSVAFETALKLNVDYFNLSTDLDAKKIKKLLPFVKSLGKNEVVVSDLVSNEISDKNYRLQLRLLKRKIKLLSKLKNKVVFIAYLFNYFNFKHAKREDKVRRKIAKMLRKKIYINPYNSYSEFMRVGDNELSAYAIGKITLDLTESIENNFSKFITKPTKVSTNYVYYSIKSSSDEPTKTPLIMTAKEKQAFIKAQKTAEKLAKKENKKNAKKRA